jgi:hypothetical protein
MNYFNSNTEKSFNEKIIRFFDLTNVKDKFSIIYEANLRLDEKGLSKVSVAMSEIESYRKS